MPVPKSTTVDNDGPPVACSSEGDLAYIAGGSCRLRDVTCIVRAEGTATWP